MIPETELKLRDKIAELREALERENNRVKELEEENASLERRFRRAASDAREAELEAPMTHQYEIVKGFNGLLAWGNRVAAEYGIVGTQDNFAFIERTLKEQQGRVAELEADRDSIARLGKAVEIENRKLKVEQDNLERHLKVRTGFLEVAQARVKELETALAELRTMNAALVSASASEQRVTWEYRYEVYKSDDEVAFAVAYQNRDGWNIQGWQLEAHPLSTGRIAIMWQRPARLESEGSE
jgi:chromosome segregation ATPase